MSQNTYLRIISSGLEANAAVIQSHSGLRAFCWNELEFHGWFPNIVRQGIPNRWTGQTPDSAPPETNNLDENLYQCTRKRVWYCDEFQSKDELQELELLRVSRPMKGCCKKLVRKNCMALKVSMEPPTLVILDRHIFFFWIVGISYHVELQELSCHFLWLTQHTVLRLCWQAGAKMSKPWFAVKRQSLEIG